MPAAVRRAPARGPPGAHGRGQPGERPQQGEGFAILVVAVRPPAFVAFAAHLLLQGGADERQGSHHATPRQIVGGAGAMGVGPIVGEHGLEGMDGMGGADAAERAARAPAGCRCRSRSCCRVRAGRSRCWRALPRARQLGAEVTDVSQRPCAACRPRDRPVIAHPAERTSIGTGPLRIAIHERARQSAISAHQRPLSSWSMVGRSSSRAMNPGASSRRRSAPARRIARSGSGPPPRLSSAMRAATRRRTSSSVDSARSWLSISHGLSQPSKAVFQVYDRRRCRHPTRRAPACARLARPRHQRQGASGQTDNDRSSPPS